MEDQIAAKRFDLRMWVSEALTWISGHQDSRKLALGVPLKNPGLPVRDAVVGRILLAIVVLGGLALNFTLASRILNDDFSGFYAGAALVGTEQLYDPAAVVRFQRDILSLAAPQNQAVRIPAYFLLFSRLAKLPYRSARIVWTGIMILCALGFVLFFPVQSRLNLLVIVLTSFPIMESLAIGQDTAVYLLAIAAAFQAHRAGYRFISGVVLSVLLFKFHISALVPLALLLRRERRALAGMVSGASALVMISFAIAGSNWIPAYVHVLTRLDPTGSSKVISIMPNLRALVLATHLPSATEIFLSILVGGGALWIASRNSTYVGIAIVLLAGVLIGHHTHVQDCALIIPLILWSFEAGGEVARILGFILAVPIIYIGAFVGHGAGLACLLGAAMLAIGCAQFGRTDECRNPLSIKG